MINIPHEDLVLASNINTRENIELSVFSSVELNFLLENVCLWNAI